MKTLHTQFHPPPAIATLVVLLCLWPVATHADDFTFTTNSGTITIAKYTGPGGAVIIPSEAHGLPITGIGDEAFILCTNLTNITMPNTVTTIGQSAFAFCTGLTSVAIPAGVTSIGAAPFAACTRLTAITVDALNPIYTSVDGVLFEYHDGLLQYPAGKVGSYRVPNGVAAIGMSAFENCTGLTTVVMPTTVSAIGDGAFFECTHLNGVYFEGFPPSSSWNWVPPFELATNVIVYYLPGTSFWGPTLFSRPTALWKPSMQSRDSTFGTATNRFGFDISWASGKAVVVEAATSLTTQTWFPVATNTLSDGYSYFSDPDWTHHPARFYRVRSL